jgi:hypothetical protein
VDYTNNCIIPPARRSQVLALGRALALACPGLPWDAPKKSKIKKSKPFAWAIYCLYIFFGAGACAVGPVVWGSFGIRLGLALARFGTPRLAPRSRAKKHRNVLLIYSVFGQGVGVGIGDAGVSEAVLRKCQRAGTQKSNVGFITENAIS